MSLEFPYIFLIISFLLCIDQYDNAHYAVACKIFRVFSRMVFIPRVLNASSGIESCRPYRCMRSVASLQCPNVTDKMVIQTKCEDVSWTYCLHLTAFFSFALALTCCYSAARKLLFFSTSVCNPATGEPVTFGAPWLIDDFRPCLEEFGEILCRTPGMQSFSQG